MYAVIAQGPAARTHNAVQRIVHAFTSKALVLLQQLNYALTNRTTLLAFLSATLFEPVTEEGRARFEADRAALTSVKAAPEAVEPMRTVAATRATLEAAILYVLTLLAMWLSKPVFDSGSAPAPGGDAGMDGDRDDGMLVEGAHSEAGAHDERRGARRVSHSIAKPLQWGMKGEMGTDLQALLNKARPVVAKGATVLNEGDVVLT